MIDLSGKIHEALTDHLEREGYDIDLVPIPRRGDRMVRLRTLEEALEEFDEGANESVTLGYIVQVRPRPKKPEPLSKADSAKPSLDGIYLPNGKLNLPYLFENAEILLKTGEYTLARNIYKTILHSGERSAQALFGMGKCFEAENQLDQALSSFEESLTYHPTFETYQRMASLLIQLKKDQQAAELLEHGINLKDTSKQNRFEMHKACGNCWLRAGRTDKAESNYVQALGLYPLADEIHANLGALRLDQERPTEAKRHFQDALTANARNEKALAGMGSALLAEGDKQKAHDYFAKALEININNPTAIFYLVKCAYEIKSYAVAARIVEEYVQNAPVNANLLYSLAGLQFHLGRVDEARSTTEKILMIQPQHAGAMELIKLIDRYAGNAR